MTLRSIWLHLRVPFSFFLLPVFWFALSQSASASVWRVVAVGFTVHLLLYPASNAYNSYFDKDEGSIGGLEAPPPVNKTLYWASWVLDIVALLIGVFVNWVFVLYLLLYGFITKAYSWNGIRIKKYPILSWVVIGIAQGGLTYALTYLSINDLPLTDLLQPRLLLGSLLATLNIMALYPLTQVYQHEEDASRGDETMSLLLGVRGTFVCTLIVFMGSLAGFYVYFEGSWLFYLFVALLLPAILYFFRWFSLVYRDSRRADYRSTMRMMVISSAGLNTFFLVLLFLKYS